mmetsp:Transcript_15847/g.30074  ORF Transcript_15847/g.30074 Transcript_15847/m.30074 type:complete len:231 (+) Transcript_15847:732-1424(+)
MPRATTPLAPTSSPPCCLAPRCFSTTSASTRPCAKRTRSRCRSSTRSRRCTVATTLACRTWSCTTLSTASASTPLPRRLLEPVDPVSTTAWSWPSSTRICSSASAQAPRCGAPCPRWTCTTRTRRRRRGSERRNRRMRRRRLPQQRPERRPQGPQRPRKLQRRSRPSPRRPRKPGKKRRCLMTGQLVWTATTRRKKCQMTGLRKRVSSVRVASRSHGARAYIEVMTAWSC